MSTPAKDFGFVDADDFALHVKRLLIKPPSLEHRLLHAAIGAAGETGEILDTVKKSWVYNQPLDTENLLEEVGDCLFYLVGILNCIGHTLPEAVEHNKAKLAKRYPQGYTDAHAAARLDKA